MAVTRRKRAGARRQPAETELLGDADLAKRINRQWRPHFQRLVDLRARLLMQQRDQFGDALAEQPAFSMHMADAGTDSYDRDLALGILSHEQDAVYEIEEALNRIRSGTYGVCELTGKKIPANRLQAIPWTRFSAAAEKSLEQRGEVRRAKLGPRETVRQPQSPPKPEQEE